jgi:hypothetical protein
MTNVQKFIAAFVLSADPALWTVVGGDDLSRCCKICSAVAASKKHIAT